MIVVVLSPSITYSNFRNCKKACKTTKYLFNWRVKFWYFLKSLWRTWIWWRFSQFVDISFSSKYNQALRSELKIDNLIWKWNWSKKLKNFIVKSSCNISFTFRKKSTDRNSTFNFLNFGRISFNLYFHKFIWWFSFSNT